MINVSRTSSSSTPISSSQRTKSPVRVQRTKSPEASSTDDANNTNKTKEENAKALKYAIARTKFKDSPGQKNVKTFLLTLKENLPNNS